MNKRTARCLAAAFVAPGAVGIAHASPAIITPRAGATVGGHGVTVFARFNAARPVASVRLFVDGHAVADRSFQPAGTQGEATFTWDASLATAGHHTLTLKTYDRSGRIVGVEDVTVNVMGSTSGQDRVPPQVAIMDPAPGEKLRGTVAVRVLATDDSGDAPYVSLFVDRELRSLSNRQPYSYTLDTTEYANGRHTIEALAADASGNKASATPMTIEVNNPGGATTLNEEVNQMPQKAADPAPAPTAAPLPAIAPVKAPATTNSSVRHNIVPVREARTALMAPTPKPEAAPVRMARAEAPKPAPRLDAPKTLRAPKVGAVPAARNPIAAKPPRPESEAAAHVVAKASPAPKPVAVKPPLAAKPAPPAVKSGARPSRASRAVKPAVMPMPPLAPKPNANPHAAPKPAPTEKPAPKAKRVPHSRAAAPAPVAQAQQAQPADSVFVLKMQGDRVVEMTPAARPKAEKKVLMAKAPVVEPGNPVLRPAHVAVHPTAPIVHAPKPAPVARVAKAQPKSEMKPAVIAPLPADRVANGRILHAVRPGETPHSIARHYGVPEKRLLASNNLRRTARLSVGRVLHVPSAVRIAVNNTPVQFDVAPRIENGVTVAAFRQVYQALGGTVTWDRRDRAVHATGGGVDIVLHVGSRTAIVNGNAVTLPAPVRIERGRALVPVQFIARSLGSPAEYDGKSGSLTLRTA